MCAHELFMHTACATYVRIPVYRIPYTVLGL